MHGNRHTYFVYAFVRCLTFKLSAGCSSNTKATVDYTAPVSRSISMSSSLHLHSSRIGKCIWYLT